MPLLGDNKHMSIEVRIPTILRPYTKDAKVVAAQGGDLAGVIADLDQNYPGLGERLLDSGALRKFINVYINDEDVRFIGGLTAPVKAGDSVTILPAVAGGQ
jgi:molybdopterin converting factor small subunit